MQSPTTFPYVKHYNENGELINPLSNHLWDGSNRRNRRSVKTRLLRNRKNHSLIVYKNMAYHKYLQIAPIWNKANPTFQEKCNGVAKIIGTKIIEHFRLKVK